MDKNKAIGYFVITVMFILGFMLIFMPDTIKEYKENGIETRVVITQKQYKGKSYEYFGIYTNQNGQLVKATVLPYRSGVETGDEIIGNYLTEKPDKVVCCNGSNPISIERIIGVILLLLGGFIIFRIIRTYNKKKRSFNHKHTNIFGK